MLDSRGGSIRADVLCRRRWHCPVCDHRFTSYELHEDRFYALLAAHTQLSAVTAALSDLSLWRIPAQTRHTQDARDV